MARGRHLSAATGRSPSLLNFPQRSPALDRFGKNLQVASVKLVDPQTIIDEYAG